MDLDDRVMSISEAAKVFGFTTGHLYELVNAGVIPCVVLRSKRVTKKTMLKFLADCNGKNYRDPNNIKEISFEDLQEDSLEKMEV